MLKRLAIPALIALATFSALFLIDRASLLVAPCGNSGGDYSDQKSANDDNCAIREGIVVAGIEWLSEKPPEVWTALATVAVAAFTLTLWLSNEKMWRITRRSVEISERALNELEAPFLVVKIISPGIDYASGIRHFHLSDLVFCFENYGRTPARILEFIERITPNKIEDGIPSPIDPDIEFGDIMPYGVVAPPNSECQPFRTPVSVDFFKDGKYDPPIHDITHSAYFRGYVRYADILDNIYTVGFSFIFDLTGNRWVLRGNKAHNYWRKEKKRSDSVPDWVQPDAKTAN